MAYRIAAAQHYGTSATTITNLIQRMRSSPPPSAIAFPNLGSPHGNTTSLITRAAAGIAWSTTAEVVRTVGMTSCAAVCFVDVSSARGYVLHANIGSVSHTEFGNAMYSMGSPNPGNVYIAYAHLGKTDQGYQGNIASIANYGIPTNNIVEITDLYLSGMGMNNKLQLGY